MREFKLVIGPDDMEADGYAWQITEKDQDYGTWEHYADGGDVYDDMPSTPDGWVNIVDTLALPPGCTAENGDVSPHGWSQGAGHAPQGIEIRWTIRVPLKTDMIYDDWTVIDPEGGRWHPDADAQAEIQASDDPEAAILAMLVDEPMRGTWES